MTEISKRDAHIEREDLEYKIGALMEWERERGGWQILDFPASPNNAVSLVGADAIQDHIAALGWMTTVYTGPYKNQGIKCRCCIMRGPQDFVLGGVDVVDDTRPMAISLAFVEAMESDE